MKLTPIWVERYSGDKAEEAPCRFLSQDQWIEISEVVDRWYQMTSLPESPVADYFKVLDCAGRQYLLKHDLESYEWYLARQR